MGHVSVQLSGSEQYRVSISVREEDGHWQLTTMPDSQARLNTFEEDLGLVGNQFNVAVSILNVG
jgi:hypothetical protein